MSKFDRMDKLDILTKTWSENYFRQKVEKYLQEDNLYHSDSVFFIQLKNWDKLKQILDSAASDYLLQQFAFVLWKTFKRTDFVARIGDACFFVFALGCDSREEVELRKKALNAQWKELNTGKENLIQIQVESVFCKENICTYTDLYECGLGLLDSPIRDIPIYESKIIEIDREFILQITHLITKSKTPHLAVEMALSQICNYFGLHRAFVVEKTVDSRYFERTYDWRNYETQVTNYNLNRMPRLMGEEYYKIFDKNHLFVCNRLDELKETDSLMEQRYRLDGMMAIMQYAMVQWGEFIGYIGICDHERERIWTRKEIATFYEVAGILSVAVFQIHAHRVSDQSEFQDRLTGSWNLSKFLVESPAKLDDRQNQAIATLDIKNFRLLNNEVSFSEGNEILKEISDVLRGFVGEKECCARMEADCFTVLICYDDSHELNRRLELLMSRIERISTLRGIAIPTVCMIGVCFVSDRNEDVSELIDKANLARKSVKNFHKSSYVVFSEELEKMRYEENQYSRVMHQALENGEFKVYYQPKVQISTQMCVGFEALIRWQRPDGTFVFPDSFIPLFEKNGFVVEIDFYVLEKVCQLLKKWIDEEKKVYPISVNFSRVHMKNQNFVLQLCKVCDLYQIPYSLIEIELTETAFFYNQELIQAVSMEIKESGFQLVIDDFGTGYSSLSLLKDIPVDVVKLDKSFFYRMGDRDKIVISNVIRMNRELEIQVLSEGIETREQEEFISKIGCDIAQGFLYSKPGPIEEVL